LAELAGPLAATPEGEHSLAVGPEDEDAIVVPLTDGDPATRGDGD